MRSSRTWSAIRAEALLGLAFALAAFAGVAARAGEWAKFEPNGGRFAVELPGTPAVERDSTWTPVGYVYMTKYWLRVDNALVAVEIHDIPPVASALITDDTILDQARDALLRDVDGTLLDGKTTVFEGAPARDFLYRLPGEARLVERVLAVLVDRRLYLVTGMGRAPGTDPEISRFFASFDCWREGNPRGPVGTEFRKNP
jgi:hypothetical protein